MKTFSAVIVLLAVVVFVVPVSAKVVTSPQLPEQAGIYDVPGHPDMKLRVFVHKAKPGPVTPTWQCGLTESDSFAVVSSAGWHLPETWTYVVNATSAPATIGAANVGAIVANSFAAWEAEVPGVSIIDGGSTSVTKATRDGRNIITWGRTSGSALAVSYIWYQGGVALEVDTIFNSRFTWYWANSGTTCSYTGVYDAQDILTHELGHTYGLDDEYAPDYANATMYGYGSPGRVNAITLSTGDKLGVKSNY